MATDNTLPLDFFNYAKLNETRNAERENKPFMWPGAIAHNINGGERKVVRGFMRSILTDESISGVFGNANSNTNNNKGHYRLNFQFNPESITRDVAQSIGAVNPILQNPANLTQAVPGTAVFNFTMTFNREMEVNNHGTENNYKDPYTDLNNPFYNLDKERDPGVIGVWADVKMFDAIIGQGITDELVSMVKVFTATQQNNINVQQNEDSTAVDADGNKIVIASTYDDAEFDKAIALNTGNSAFLNPLPVRVVFSDTFMLEGLVEGAAVAFQKFSPNMTPTICQINVNFKALYLGFAKKDAFLTSNLSNWAADTIQTQEEDAAEITTLSKTLGDGFKLLQFCPGGTWSKNNKKIENDYTHLNSSYYPRIQPTSTSNLQWWNSDEYWHSPSTKRTGTEKYPGVSADPAYVTLQQWWNICNSNWAATPNSYTWRPYLKAERTDTWKKGRFDETFQNVKSTIIGKMPCIFAWSYEATSEDLKNPDIDLVCNLSYSYKGETFTADCTITEKEVTHLEKFGYVRFLLELPKTIKTTFINKSVYSDTQIMMSAAVTSLRWKLIASKEITTTSSGSTQKVKAEKKLDCLYTTNGFYYTDGLSGLRQTTVTQGTGGSHGSGRP